MPEPSSTPSTAPIRSGSGQRGADVWAGATALALAAVVASLAYWLGSIEPSWDVLERSDILSNWSTAPRTHRSFRSHVLELWLARPFHALVGGPGNETGGLRALGSVSLGGLAGLLVWVGGRGSGWALLRSVGVAVGICFAAASLGLGSSGEEKVVAATSMCLAGAAVASLLRTPEAPPWRAAAVGLTCAIAVFVHLVNGVVLVGLLGALALTFLPRLQHAKALRLRVVIAGTTAGLTVALGYMVLAQRWYPDAARPLVTSWEAITSYHGPAGVAREGRISEGLAAVVGPMPGAAGVYLLLALAPFVMLTLRARAEPSRWPLVGFVAAAALAWIWNFHDFEPQNPESWLGLWCWAGLAWVLSFEGQWLSRRTPLLATTIAACVAAVAMLGTNALGLGQRGNSAQAWADGVQQACGDDAMVLTTGREFRAARVYSEMRVVEAGELFGTPVEYTGRAPTPPTQVDRHRERATVCVSSSAASVLAPIGPTLEPRQLGRVSVFVLTSDLVGAR